MLCVNSTTDEACDKLPVAYKEGNMQRLRGMFVCVSKLSSVHCEPFRIELRSLSASALKLSCSVVGKS